MKPRINVKIVLIALLLAGAFAGFGYGMAATAKSGESQAAATATVSAGSPMVPGNFSNLAEMVKAGVVNIQVSKKVTGIPSGISSVLSAASGTTPPRGNSRGWVPGSS
jgi:hypothetical protein